MSIEKLQSARKDSLLRRPEVLRRTGLGTTTLYKLMSEGLFERPVFLGCRAVAWPESVVDAWVAARIAGVPLSIKE